MWVLSAPLFALAATAAACTRSGEHALTPTDLARGTTGIAQVERIEGDALLVTVELDRLPPPAGASAEATTYVLWLDGGGVVTSAPLSYDARRRRAIGFATTLSRPFSVRVTAETEPRPARPSEHDIVHGNVSTE